MEIKHRTGSLALKALGTDGRFAGYASVFDVVDHYNEAVVRGAFKKTLEKWSGRQQMPAMLWMHDVTQPIGLWISMEEDEHGLCVSGQLALRTAKGTEAYELLKMGALTGLSIGYRVVRSSALGKGRPKLLTEVDLFEISLVTFPANEEARVGEVRGSKKPRMRRVTDEDKTRAVVDRLQQAARALQQTKRG